MYAYACMSMHMVDVFQRKEDQLFMVILSMLYLLHISERSTTFLSACLQNSVNWEDFNAKIIVQNDNRSSHILSIVNQFHFLL